MRHCACVSACTICYSYTASEIIWRESKEAEDVEKLLLGCADQCMGVHTVTVSEGAVFAYAEFMRVVEHRMSWRHSSSACTSSGHPWLLSSSRKRQRWMPV